MLPYATLIPLDRQLSTPLSTQIANALIRRIRQGVVSANAKLPGSRVLAEMLGVHRKTVLAAFDELTAQGWLTQIPAKGTFVSSQLPDVTPCPLTSSAPAGMAQQTGFTTRKRPFLEIPVLKTVATLSFDDGMPDLRLAPVAQLGRNYRNILNRGFQQHLMGYADTNGTLFFRQQLANYLRDSRGIPATPDHIFTTRGSIMAIYLLSKLLLEPGDVVLVGELSYQSANMVFDECGANRLKIPVDAQGLVVAAIEAICQKQPVRLVYVTPHHHYPTTVTLSAERRIKLLQLAEQYGFVVLEDDYDYDFHYAGSPILPLASADAAGMVVYVGSFTKSIAPAFRVGYMVCPPNLVAEIGYLRRIIDRQGDTILEQAIAEMLAEGEVQKHLKKAQKTYHARRDHFCDLLKTTLGDAVSFTIPDGGMAVWTEFDKAIDLHQLAARCRDRGLMFNNGRFYQPTAPTVHHTRLGFASKTPDELEQGVAVLKKCTMHNV
ncbi:MocR-like pyridoxine biosynthesis transcription factor PdxR [Fibrella aquatilis]|uniref:PLP-dependent aminotransferase family protein n=1 Tax=Fibrella aquatilis TaxID=2817059 RepID=A0A939G658_9BACT|nr:PLP-dependent aminotransferase family protein [Fibrella aquatilis]MBO0930917.1 PLP-dependent aminotransferase family protein [Fibrella aquatilis]